MGFIDDRLKATEDAIIEAESAEASILDGAVQSYTLDTGQTRTTVTRANIRALRTYIDSLYNRRATLRARLGKGARTMRPDY